VIIDECHYVNAMEGMYRDFLMSIGDCRILGLTATPFRLATNSFGSELRFLTRTRPRVFEDVVHVTQIGDLFDGGYLCPLEYRREVAIDEDQLKLNSTGADYTDESVRKHLREIDFGDRLALNVQAQLDDGRRSVVVFTRFVEEAAALAKALGNSAAMVHSGSTPAERQDILARFRAGQLRVVTNVGIIATGFDFPALDTVVLARPTMSLAVYYQQVGRVVRTDATKTSARVVDLVGLSRGFGRIENLELRNDGGPKWAFYSGKRRLTNKTFTKLSMMHG
jgi:DNA repair protein RadD